jgi:hypothetical protein
MFNLQKNKVTIYKKWGYNSQIFRLQVPKYKVTIAQF